MQQREQALESVGGRGQGVVVLLVEPGLDRLRVPVAEVVEREVVEPLGGRCEAERGEIGLDLGSNGLEPSEDPALDRVARARRGCGGAAIRG